MGGVQKVLSDCLVRMSAWQRIGKHSSATDLKKFFQTVLNLWDWIDIYKLRKKALQFIEDQETQLLDNRKNHSFSERQLQGGCLIFPLSILLCDCIIWDKALSAHLVELFYQFWIFVSFLWNSDLNFCCHRGDALDVVSSVSSLTLGEPPYCGNCYLTWQKCTNLDKFLRNSVICEINTPLDNVWVKKCVRRDLCSSGLLRSG